jgi:hypothetical protein
MEFRILGPLEVRDGDAVLEVRGEKQRALLGVLLLSSGSVVSTDRRNTTGQRFARVVDVLAVVAGWAAARFAPAPRSTRRSAAKADLTGPTVTLAR